MSIQASDMNGFGRLVLTFDAPPKVQARSANSVLVLSFSEPVTIKRERIVSEMGAYVSLVRVDPDRRAIRMVLNRPIRPNIIEANEQIYIDLLPDTWRGDPPGLPQDVVDALVRRVKEAEVRARENEALRRMEEARPIGFEVSTLPTLTRITFKTPGIVPIDLVALENEAELTFMGKFSIAKDRLKTILPSHIRSVTSSASDVLLTLNIAFDSDYDVRGFREDEYYVLDISRRATPNRTPVADSKSPILNSPPAVKGEAETNPEMKPETKPASVQPPMNALPPQRAEGPNNARSSPPPISTEPIKPFVAQFGDSTKIVFPFTNRTPAAAFERAGVVTLFFETEERFEEGARLDEAGVRLISMTRHYRYTMVKLGLKQPGVVRLAPESNGWALTVGEEGLAPVQPIMFARTVDDQGRTTLTAQISNPSSVHWIDDPDTGLKMAVVTALAPIRAVSRAQNFPEFHLLPTAHGLSILAKADDLTVRPDFDGVVIARDAGLMVTMAGDGPVDENSPALNLIIDRDHWNEVRLGNVRQNIDELRLMAAQAPRSEKTRARLNLAKTLLANDLTIEAFAVLGAITLDDPPASQTRELLIMKVAGLVLQGRLQDVPKLLAGAIVAEDPEAALWRAALDAKLQRWPQALVGFRRSTQVMDAYPESLQAKLRPLALRAAVAQRDFAIAEAEFEALRQLPPGTISRNEQILLKSLIDEASGRFESALVGYQALSSSLSTERPLAAEAMLRGALLALREKTKPREEIAAQLETLAVIWRKDDIEARTLSALGRLYAELERWRDAFKTVKRANIIYPDHEEIKALHDETARLFEELFLTGKGDSIGRVDAIALYYDFQEFTPIGRRGDEIIRRLSNRLVELDLLEQASELLQYQVTHRLNGAARATVAARLATIRLMNGQAAQALKALQETRLPELPSDLKRARLLLEARALSDLSRTGLAMELLVAEQGPEIERLRADILWQGRRWRDAGEQHERILGDAWRGKEPLTEQNRTDVMRAAIAYALSDETLSLDRLRVKYGAKMADSEDARTFAFLTQPNVSSTKAFRDVARTVVNADTLADFLTEYRKRYPDVATSARPRRPPVEGGSPPQSGANLGANTQGRG